MIPDTDPYVLEEEIVKWKLQAEQNHRDRIIDYLSDVADMANRSQRSDANIRTKESHK